MPSEKVISITTVSPGGESQEIRAKCRCYSKEGKEHVLFEADGDRCRISFDKSSLTYRRQGELSFELFLSAGTKTDVKMYTSYGASEITCFTEAYNVSETGDAIRIDIKYNMAEEARKMEIIIKEKI